MSNTLFDTFNWWAVERAEVDALICGDDHVTYAELRRWSRAAARWLQAQGVERGDRVGVMASNSLQWAVLSQAAMLAEVILAPVNPRFTFSEASYLLSERYQVRLIFHDDERTEVAGKIADQMAGVQTFSVEIMDQLRHAVTSDEGWDREIPADTDLVIIPTSGSTGRPKGVVLSHRSVIGYSADACLTRPGQLDKASALLFAPLCTSGGYVVLTQILICGGTLFIEKAFDAEMAIHKIEALGIDTLLGTPIFFERMAACPGFQQKDFSKVRFCTIGGARVTRAVLEAWLNKGVILRQLYGQTEVGGQATANTDTYSISHPEKCGRGSVLTRLGIIDPAGNFLPPNTVGEIVVKGPGVMERYWDDPESTAKTLVDGWVHTGDLGVIDENGLLTMLDRMKDIIISGGLNISAAEVERVIAEYPGVEEVAVIAAPDSAFGETPLAVIHGIEETEIHELLAHCAMHLTSYKLPRYMACSREPLPRLASGKISKPILREQYATAHLTLTKLR